MIRNVRILLLALLAAIFAGAGVILWTSGVQPAFAQPQAQAGVPRTPTDDEVNAVAHQLYCPVCENIPLDVCPTQACSQWRAQIRDMLAKGKTEAEIKQYFVVQYGDRVLAAPPARGLNWLVYVIPPVAFLAGAFILYRALMSWRAASAKAVTDPALDEVNDEYVARIEEELRKR